MESVSGKGLDKKSIISLCCGNKTTVYSDRALNVIRLPHPCVWDIVNVINVLKGSGKPHPSLGYFLIAGKPRCGPLLHRGKTSVRTQKF